MGIAHSSFLLNDYKLCAFAFFVIYIYIYITATAWRRTNYWKCDEIEE